MSKQLDRENVAKRDEILFGAYNPKMYSGGVRGFHDVDLETLVRLRDEQFLDIYEQHNCAPEIGDIMEFLADHENFLVGGYAVSANREDYRVSIDTIYCEGDYDYKDIFDFVKVFRFADEFVANEETLYAWFD